MLRFTGRKIGEFKDVIFKMYYAGKQDVNILKDDIEVLY